MADAAQEEEEEEKDSQESLRHKVEANTPSITTPSSQDMYAL
jgi:hypothetical protein